MKGSLGFFRVTLCGGKDCWPRRSKQAGRVPPLTQRGMRRAVVGLVQCSLAIVLTPMALGLGEKLICGSATFRDGDERQQERSTWLNDGSAPAKGRVRNTRTLAGLRLTAHTLGTENAVERR